MKIMDLLVDELNNNLTDGQKNNGEKFERLHSEQYQIVQTENGTFYNPISVSKAIPQLLIMSGWGYLRLYEWIFCTKFVLKSFV